MSTKLMEAIDFAAQKHFNQIRRDNVTPYLAHPLSVSLILSKMAEVQEDTIISAVLHDTLEDTNTTQEEIKNKFGQNVLDIVLEVTDIDGPNITHAQRKQESLERIKKLSKEAAKLKYADLLCNTVDLLVKIKIDKKYANIFSTPIDKKIEYDIKRLGEFKTHHINIDTFELEKNLFAIKNHLHLS